MTVIIFTFRMPLFQKIYEKDEETSIIIKNFENKRPKGPVSLTRVSMKNIPLA